jgi:hypothetical protein
VCQLGLNYDCTQPQLPRTAPQVLEGYHALGSGAGLGPEVGAAFVAAATAATLKVWFCSSVWAAERELSAMAEASPYNVCAAGSLLWCVMEDTWPPAPT